MTHTPFARRILHLVPIVICLAVAAGLRLPDLTSKPMHGDEANQAHKAGRLLEGHGYRYDPHEHHGPTLYYATLPVAWLKGQWTFADTDEWTYRIVPALFGIALIGLVLGLRGALTAKGAMAAALLLAVSPAFVFYSRYYIQEMLLIFFTALALVACWGYCRAPGARRAGAIGVSLGLMHATKETSALAVLAMLLALAGVLGWEYARGRAVAFPKGWQSHLGIGIAAGAVVSIAFFSSFGSNPRGVLDSVLTYTHYLERTGGEGSTAMHEQPFHYYLSMLAWTQRPLGPVWSEGLVLVLGVLGAFAIIRGRFAPSTRARHFQRFLLGFAVLLTLMYSVISYKTPWNVLSFYLGIMLLAGIGAAWLIARARWWPVRLVVAVVLAAFTVQLAGQAQWATGRFAADPRNPYVYAHTSTALLRLAARAEELAEVHPDGHGLPIEVIHPAHDYWPLPWYLRKFPNTRYRGALVADAPAAMVLMPSPLAREHQEDFARPYTAESHSLRPGVLWVAFIERGLWAKFMEGRQ